MSEFSFSTEQVQTSDGIMISMDRYMNGHSDVIVIAHGFYNSKQAVLLKKLAGDLIDNFDVIVMDFRGHGQSSGLFYWTSKEYLDLEAVLKFARKNYQKVGVIGFSLGAATSLITAARSDLMDSLVAVSAPTAFGKIEYHFWGLDLENDIVFGLLKEGGLGKGVRPGPFWEQKEKPVDCVEKIKVPVCYIHGQKDWLIHPWHSQKLYDQTRSLKRIALIPDGSHAEYLVRKNHKEFTSIVREWFVKTLRPSSSPS